MKSNLMKETTSTTTDIDSLAAAIIQLEIQNITLLKSNGNIEIKSLEERLQKLQEENKKLVHISSTSSGNVLDFSDGNVSTTTTTTAFFPIPTELDKDKPTTVDNSIKKGDSKSFNLLAPEKVKRNRSEDIAKSARRLKKLVAEMQQNIQPLAPSAKFDEIHINEYQYFLNPQSIRSVGGDGSRTKRIMTVGSTDTTELSSVPLEAENLEISGDTTDLTQLPPVVVLEGRVSESDYKDTGRSEASFSGHFDSMDINSSELPPSFIGTIHGSFEFCVIEADLRVLIPSDESRLRRSPTQVRSTAQSSQIQGYNMLVSHNGSNRILSSYFPSRATYNYPQTLSAPSIENISDFCFPSGVSVNICGVASANCFIDSSNDKFHVMQFTNSYGHITYACCLTIRKAMQLPTDSEIAKQILLLSVQQKAARIIMKILRYYAMISKRNKWQSYSQKVSRPKLSPAPPPSLSRPVSLTSPNSRTLSTSDAQSPENISFFSKYFRPSSLSTQKKTLVTDLTTMYNDIIMIMNDDGEDISLQKLVELSTTLKKARDAGCVADVFPVLAKCDSLLNSYGVGLEPNDKATHRKFLPTGSSGVSSTSTIASTVVASNNGHDSHTDARLSVSPTRTSAMTEGGEEENKTVGSSNTDNKLHVITDNIDPLSPDSEDSESSSESESSQHMAAFKDYYKSDSELTHKLPWEHMMDPTGKVMITHQAYCVVTSSPHHALFYQMLMEMANADRRKSSTTRDVAVESITSLYDRVEKRHRLLEQVHRLIESQPELYLEPLIDSSGDEPVLTKSTMLLSVPTASPRIGRRKVSLLVGADIATPRTPTISSKAPRTPLQARFLRSASSHTATNFPLVSTPGYVERLLFDPYKYPTTQEWTTAVLFSCLSSVQIFKICNLLLMEKSLVIVGEDVGIVTALAFAVSALLTPFQWQGVFIPLVPNMVREIFDAPVPFIVGSTAAPVAGEVSTSAAVLVIQKTVPVSTNLSKSLSMSKASSSRKKSAVDLQRDKLRQEALSTGIVGFSGWFTRLPEVNTDVPIEGELTEAVNRACKFFQFEYIFERRRSKLYSNQTGASRVKISESQIPTILNDYVHDKQINIMLMNHMSSPEVRLVNNVLELMSCHNLRFTGDLCDYTAWPRYVRCYSASGDEEFLPELFMEPIKRLLEFHEAVVQTQMFVGFVDRIRVEQKSLDPFRLFLRDWIYFRLYMRGVVKSAHQSNDRLAFTG